MKKKHLLVFVGLVLSSLFFSACDDKPGGKGGDKTDCTKYNDCIKECDKHYQSCMKSANDGLDAAEKAYKDAIKECDRIYFNDIKNCTNPKTKADCIKRCDDARAACEVKADQALAQQRKIYADKIETCRSERADCEKKCRQANKDCADKD